MYIFTKSKYSHTSLTLFYKSLHSLTTHKDTALGQNLFKHDR